MTPATPAETIQGDLSDFRQRSGHGEGSGAERASGGVVGRQEPDLLAALGRSIEAAKAARAER